MAKFSFRNYFFRPSKYNCFSPNADMASKGISSPSFLFLVAGVCSSFLAKAFAPKRPGDSILLDLLAAVPHAFKRQYFITCVLGITVRQEIYYRPVQAGSVRALAFRVEIGALISFLGRNLLLPAKLYIALSQH